MGQEGRSDRFGQEGSEFRTVSQSVHYWLRPIESPIQIWKKISGKVTIFLVAKYGS